jgi:hypothetical protein
MPSDQNRHRPDEPRVLNAPLIRAMMLGAGITSDAELCEQIGINPSNFSRCMRRPQPGQRRQEPSLRLVDALARRFRACPYWLLVVPPGEEHDPGIYGMTWPQVEDGFPAASPAGASS